VPELFAYHEVYAKFKKKGLLGGKKPERYMSLG
jgi:hypothetical protein